MRVACTEVSGNANTRQPGLKRCNVSDDEMFRLARDVDARCRLRGDFLLRSGQRSDEYFDKYLFESDPVLLRRVVEQMVEHIPTGTQMLGGLELGGIPLATVLSSLSGLPTLFVRKKAKEYGTLRLAEGGDPSGHTVLLVEDVITTGGAVRDAAGALRALGATVTHVVCAIDRSRPGSNPLADADLTIASVLTKELLDAVTS
jgi:orotate phosphoribosyltransferase